MTTETRPPRVSVIMIFLNAERYMEEAINSVLAQTFDDFDLILVDDGSTDRSTEIAKDYARRSGARVRWTEHADHINRGMSASRNTGLRLATAAYVAFIDADDVWTPHKLAEQVAILDTYPSLGLVCGTVRYWRSWQEGKDTIITTGHVADRVVPPPEAAIALYPLGTAGAPCPSDLLLRRAAVEQVAGFEEHFTGPRQMYEDQGFLAKLYLTAPVYFSSAIWLDYRQHEQSCVTQVKRDGQYLEVRKYFLNWYAAYLDTQSLELRAAVGPALRRAQWSAQHPRVDTLLRRLRSRANIWLGAARRVCAPLCRRHATTPGREPDPQ